METPENYAMNDSYMMQQGYPINNLEYHPQQGMIQQLMKFIMGKISPYQQRVEAPIWMYQNDMSKIVANTNIANSMRQNDNMNPVMLSAMSTMMRSVGISDPSSYLYDQSGQPSALGNMITSYIPKIFKMDNPWMNMGTSQVSLWNQMKGLSLVGDPNAIYRPGMGLSQFQSEDLLTSLMKGTYSDSMLTQQRGLWGQKDIVEISGIGRDYGLFRGASKADLPKRIQDFGSVVSQSMMTFNTPDKESAVRMLIEATGGGIDLNNTSELRNTLDRIKGLSESANLSIQVLKSAIQRGQEVSKLMGLSTMTGTNIVMGAMTSLRTFGGDHSIPIGEKEALATISDVSTQVQASEVFTNATKMYGALRKYDPQGARKLEKEYFSKGTVPTTIPELEPYRTELKKKLITEKGLSEGQAEVMIDNMMVEESARGSEAFSKNYYETYLLELGSQTMRTMRLNDPNSEKLYSEVIDQKDNASQGAKDYVKSNFTRTLYESLRSKGQSHEQAMKTASVVEDNYFNREKVLAEKGRREEAEKIRLTRERAMEVGRTVMSPLQKGFNNLAITGNVLSAIQAGLGSPESIMSLFNTSTDFNEDKNVKKVMKAHDEIYKTFDGELMVQHATNLVGGFAGSEWLDINKTKLEDLKSYAVSDDYKKRLQPLTSVKSSVSASEVQLELKKQGIDVSMVEALKISYQVSSNKSRIEETYANAPKIRQYKRESDWLKFKGSEAYLQILRDAGADESTSYTREAFRTIAEKSGQLQKFYAATGKDDDEIEEAMKASRQTVEHQLKASAKEYASLVVEQEGTLKRDLMIDKGASFIEASKKQELVKNINEIEPGGQRDTNGKLAEGFDSLFTNPKDLTKFKDIASLYGKPYALHQVLKDKGGWQAFTTDVNKFAKLYRYASDKYLDKIDVGTTIESVRYGRGTEAEHQAAKAFISGKGDDELAELLASQRKNNESQEEYEQRVTSELKKKINGMSASDFKEHGNVYGHMDETQRIEAYRKLKGYTGMTELEMVQADALSDTATMSKATGLSNKAVLYEAVEEKNRRLTKQLAPGMEKIIGMMEKVTNFEGLLSGIKDVLEQIKTTGTLQSTTN